MKRPFTMMILSLGAAALLASPAFAQNRGFGGRGGGLGLLTNPGVQKELKLDSEQTEKVEAIAKEIQEKHADDFQKLRDLDAAERREKMTELGKTLNAETSKALAGVLKPEQIKRYDQIRLQVSGLQAFSDPKVEAKLNLTDEQKSKIREIAEASRASFAGGFNKDASAEEKAEARKKRAATQKENLNKVQALLTPDQKSTWKELTGEPFEYQPQARRPN